MRQRHRPGYGAFGSLTTMSIVVPRAASAASIPWISKSMTWPAGIDADRRRITRPGVQPTARMYRSTSLTEAARKELSAQPGPSV